MKKVLILTATIFAMTTTAFADNDGDRRHREKMRQAQAQGQIQGQLQGQLQGQAQQAVINDTGDAYAPSTSGNNPCGLGFGIGLAGVGTPVSAGAQIAGRNCVVRQEAAMLSKLGGPRMGLHHAAKHLPRVRATLKEMGVIE